jgi:hypothetical protein
VDYLKVVDGPSGGFRAGFRGEYDFEFTLFFGDKVCAAVLIAKGMTTDDDGLFPAGDETGDTFHDDGFTEDCSVEDIPDGSVWRFPHFLQVEFFYQDTESTEVPLTRASSGVMVAHLIPTLYF